ncbi:MAG: type VI secretion system baseplate subunit TssG [Propionivibrio sp.]
MARADRRSARDLVREIESDGPRFRFFQAIRLLALSADEKRDKAAIPATLRFSSPLSLAFPASEIHTVEIHRGNAPDDQESTGHAAANGRRIGTLPFQPARQIDVSVAFMGFIGPSGILPTPYTELFIDRRQQFRDKTGHAFLDMFTHRAVSLFYQAWRKFRFYLPYEAGNSEGFSRNLLDIVGVGLHHLRQRLLTDGGGIPDRFLIHYAGLLSQKPVPTVNIAALVRGFFGIEARVESYVGQWMTLPITEQSALDGRPCRLGRNTFVGERLWERQNKIRLELGPLGWKQFSSFLPDQPGFLAMRELLRFCVGQALDCDVTLIIKRAEIPEPVLCGTSDAPRLGYSLWLNSQTPCKNANDASFALLGSKARTHDAL